MNTFLSNFSNELDKEALLNEALEVGKAVMAGGKLGLAEGITSKSLSIGKRLGSANASFNALKDVGSAATVAQKAQQYSQALAPAAAVGATAGAGYGAGKLFGRNR